MDLMQVQYAVVKPFQSQAAKDRVSITETRSSPCRWYCVFGMDGVAGICGMARMLGSSRLRIRGVWVRREYRGKGIGSFMVKTLIRLAQDEPGISSIEACAINPKFYAGLKFKQVSPAGLNGVTFMRRVF